MLISCPKCHSIYEIPDDLIKKTGQNFRCHACSNVWHALPEDALGYEEDDINDIPYIEEIEVSDPPHHPYPSVQKNFIIPADTKPGKKTYSSKEIIAKEGKTDIKTDTKKNNKEITLTSDYGTSFTISTNIDYSDKEDKKTPYLYESDSSIHATEADRLQPKKAKSHRLRHFLWFLILMALLALFFRREIVAIYPNAENWYNKIMLSGINNPEYLKFENLKITETDTDNDKKITIRAEIINKSPFLATRIPPITIKGEKKTFKAKRDFLKAGEKTVLEITLPFLTNNSYQNLILGFQKP